MHNCKRISTLVSTTLSEMNLEDKIRYFYTSHCSEYMPLIVRQARKTEQVIFATCLWFNGIYWYLVPYTAFLQFSSAESEYPWQPLYTNSSRMSLTKTTSFDVFARLERLHLKDVRLTNLSTRRLPCWGNCFLNSNCSGIAFDFLLSIN